MKQYQDLYFTDISAHLLIVRLRRIQDDFPPMVPLGRELLSRPRIVCASDLKYLGYDSSSLAFVRNPLNLLMSLSLRRQPTLAIFNQKEVTAITLLLRFDEFSNG